MARYVVEPMRDFLAHLTPNLMPAGVIIGTDFRKCDEADATVWAVIDTDFDEIVDDCDDRAAADALAASLEASPEPSREDRWAEYVALGGEGR